jgi:hypothetical protein
MGLRFVIFCDSSFLRSGNRAERQAQVFANGPLAAAIKGNPSSFGDTFPKISISGKMGKMLSSASEKSP